jgi:hypothetical protein
MGGTVALPRAAGGRAARPLRVEVDLDPGPAWPGRRLSVQALRPGRRLPTLAAAVEVAVPSPAEPAVAFELEVEEAGGPWLVLRVSDPEQPSDPRATGPWAELGRGLAYASPFWLDYR